MMFGLYATCKGLFDTNVIKTFFFIEITNWFRGGGGGSSLGFIFKKYFLRSYVDPKYISFCMHLVKIGSVVKIYYRTLRTYSHFLETTFLGSRDPKTDVSSENSKSILCTITTFFYTSRCEKVKIQINILFSFVVWEKFLNYSQRNIQDRAFVSQCRTWCHSAHKRCLEKCFIKLANL